MTTLSVRYFLAFAALSLAACESRDPVAEDANDLADPAPTEASSPAAGAPPPNVAAPAAASATPSSAGPIPIALQGRWGLTPADCVANRSDTKGLLVITAGELRFYESVARPLPNVESTSDSVGGDFAFAGEGQTWTRNMTLGLRGDELTRTESRPAQSFTYARCI